MWNIQKVVSKGDYIYAVVPEHPKATKNHYVLLHRIIMENHLGRLLSENEVVHHKDHNKKNNNISNLEVLNKRTHSKIHKEEVGRKIAILKCPWCKKEFMRYENTTHLVKPSKYNCTCCSSSCRGKLYRYIQLNGITPEISEAISNNLQCSYRRYISN